MMLQKVEEGLKKLGVIYPLADLVARVAEDVRFLVGAAIAKPEKGSISFVPDEGGSNSIVLRQVPRDGLNAFKSYRCPPFELLVRKRFSMYLVGGDD